jgi:hypothetical protein
MMEDRMRRDKKFLQGRWPQDPIFLKSQPWKIENAPRSAWLYKANKLAVVEIGSNSPIQTYKNIDDLVYDWSVD